MSDDAFQPCEGLDCPTIVRTLSPHFQQVFTTTAFRWWEPNHANPAVQLALRDLVRSSDFVFEMSGVVVFIVVAGHWQAGRSSRVFLASPQPHYRSDVCCDADLERAVSSPFASLPCS